MVEKIWHGQCIIGKAGDGRDLAIRRAEFVDSGIIAYKLGGDLRHAVAASPWSLASLGEPACPEALREHSCMRSRRPANRERDRWQFRVRSEPLVVAVESPLIASHCAEPVAAAC